MMKAWEGAPKSACRLALKPSCIEIASEKNAARTGSPKGLPTQKWLFHARHASSNTAIGKDRLRTCTTRRALSWLK